MAPHEYQLEIDEKEHAHSILKSFGIMREKEEHSELTIKVGDKELRVNRDLMIAASGYISGMFAHDTVEKKTGVLDMKDVEFDLVKKCLDFIYTGKISVSLEKSESLLYVACLMQLWTLREHIGSFLQKHVSVRNFFQVWKLGIKFSVENLNKFCCQFAYENLDSLAEEKGFEGLEADDLSSFLSVRKSLRLGGEDRKVLVILKWIKHNLEERCQDLVNLFKFVDLAMVSHIYKKTLIESEPVIYKSADCMRMFCLATLDNLGVKRQKMDPDMCHIPNTLITFDSESQALKAYKPFTLALAKISDLDPNMCSQIYTAAAVECHVFVFMKNRKVFRLNIFEPEQGWKEMHEMRIHESRVSQPQREQDLEEEDEIDEILGPNISCAVLNGYIYVAGNDLMRRYSLAGNGWEEVESVGVSLSKPVLVSHQDEMYNIGNSVSSAQKYSPSLDIWTAFSPLQAMREMSYAVSFQEKIYSLTYDRQLYVSRPSCSCYDKKCDAWSVIPVPDLIAFRELKLFTCTGALRIMGAGNRNSMFRYSSSKKRWTKHPLPSGLKTDLPILSMWLP